MASEKRPLKAVIFDMDGTILDTDQAWNLAIHKALQDFKVVYSQEEFDRYNESGQSVADFSRVIKTAFKIEAHADKIHDVLVKNVRMTLDKGVPFIEGFEQFHNALSAHNLKSSLATNSCDRTLAALDTSMDLASFFGKHLYNVTHVPHPKPAPDLFLHAAAKLGVEPCECVVFEDSLFGFEAARAAGMPCVAIRNDENKHQLHQVAAAVDHYHDAMELLKSLFSVIPRRST